MAPTKLLPRGRGPGSRAVILLVFIAWAPLAMLSLGQDRFLGDTVRIPFLFAVTTHVRFLVRVPLSIPVFTGACLLAASFGQARVLEKLAADSFISITLFYILTGSCQLFF